jgi:hypothetical protein
MPPHAGYSSSGVALLLGVGDVIIYITNGDFSGRFAGPGKKEPQITGVVKVSSGMLALAAEPLAEIFDFNVHN